MRKEILVFNRVNSLPPFQYTGAEIARWSGLGTSQVSRFLNAKTDLSVSKFFQLIDSMPASFQKAYWSELLDLEDQEKTWQSMISRASISDIEHILNSLAKRWTELMKSKKEALANMK